MIPKSVTKQVIDATDIVEVIGEYVTLKKKGTSYFGLCPFHDDKNPSMSVSGEKKIFNCFSCGTKGNVIYFVAKHDNLTMEQATIKLAKRAGIKIDDSLTLEDAKKTRLYNLMSEAYNFYRFYLYSSEEGRVALEYLKRRGITDKEIDEFKIGLAPKALNYLNQALSKKGYTNLDQLELGLIKDDNGQVRDVFRDRIMFSICNPSGQIVGFSGRIYETSDQAKYINSTENYIFHKAELLYHYHEASLEIRKLNQVFIFEGFMDIIAVNHAGINNSVATMGTALSKEHLKLITDLTKNVVLFFDGDEAGIKAMKRSAGMFSSVSIIPNAVMLPDNLDPDEYITKYGAIKFQEYVQNNMKNVYLVLYQNALKKVFLGDFTTVQTFKNEVIELMRMARNEVITNYFINQMATDLKVDVSNLKNEIDNLIDYHHSTYIDEQSTPQELNPEIPLRKKKIVKITPKVVIAYNTIIKFSVGSKDLFTNAFLEIARDDMIRYPGSSLIGQFDLLYVICQFYSDYGDKEGIGEDKFYELLKDKPDGLKLAKAIFSDSFIDTKNQQLFKDSLLTIKDYFIKLDNAASYNAALFGLDGENNKNVNDFMELNKIQKKIVNEEDF